MPEEPGTDDDEFEARVEQVIGAISERGGVDVSPERLEATVREVLAELRRAPVQDFVRVVAERKVRERLRRSGEPPPT